MALSADRIVRVTRQSTPRVSAARDFNKTLLIHTPEPTTDLAALRAGSTVRSYANLDQVAEDWVSGTEPYGAASVYYQQTPRPIGEFAVASYFPSAVDGRVVGADTSVSQAEAQALGSSFAFTFLGADITADLSAVTSPVAVATALQTALQTVFTGVSVTASQGAALGSPHNYVVVVPGAVASDQNVVNINRGFVGASTFGLDGADKYARPFGADADIGAALTRATGIDDSVYWITLSRDLMSRTSAPLPADTITAASEWAEAREYAFGFDYSGADALVPNDSSSLLANLFALNRNRTFAFYTESIDYSALSLIARFASSNYAGVDSTINGANWALPGVTPDNQLSEGEANELVRKGVNYYARVGGFNVARRGTTFGEFIDKVVWEDWFAYTLQRRVTQHLIARPRVPLSSRGTREIKAVARGVCEQGRRNGGLTPGTLSEDDTASFRNRSGNQAFDGNVPAGYAMVSAPQSTADTATRTAPEIYIVGLYSGGVNAVVINLQV